MSYVDQKRGPSATGIAGAVIVQASIGAMLLAGLSITQVITQEKEAPPLIEFETDPPPPPPPPPPSADMPKPSEANPPITTPQPPFTLDPAPPTIPTTPKIYPERPIILDPGPAKIVEPVIPKPAPSFTPVSAKPRNNPGGWLTDRDYRPAWSRRELTGTAGFRLDIAANGKVTGCQITKSTGHEQLDEATCKLLPSRAKFEPARGPNGEPVAGQYNGSVLWKLPE